MLSLSDKAPPVAVTSGCHGTVAAADPVVYFAGGPGGSAVADIPSELLDLLNLNAHRDLVFIEQRGTGESSPLTCPAFTATLADQAALRASVTSCLAHLGGDLRFYTTAMYADDVNQVLGDLHYAKVNLMGISYGTAVEQVFLLRHPARVRTIIMQSGSPLDVHAIERSPWVLPAAQSPTHKTQRLRQDDLAGGLYQAMYGFNEALIPAAVHTLATARNKAAAVAAVISAGQVSGGQEDGGGPNLMMPDTITRDEPWAADRPAAMSGERASFAYRTDVQVARWWQVVCPLIPKSAAAVGDLRLRKSRVPVLAFNGAGDPIEQPRNWAGARKFHPNSRDIALPGQGHDVDSASWQACTGTTWGGSSSTAPWSRRRTGRCCGGPAG